MIAQPSLCRRDVLKAGGAAACAASLAAPGWSPASPGGFVADSRFAESHFAAPPIGAWHEVIDGDVTRLWVDRLDALWRTPGPVLAGVTGEDALFVLEHLAWDRRRRVLLREAVPSARGPVPLVRWLIADRGAARA